MEKYTEQELDVVVLTIHQILKNLNLRPEDLERGYYEWKVSRGSATITLSYIPSQGFVCAESILVECPDPIPGEMISFLLRENHQTHGFTLSIRDQKVILSLLIYDLYLHEKATPKKLNELFDLADHYDNILVERFGARWIKTPNSQTLPNGDGLSILEHKEKK